MLNEIFSPAIVRLAARYINRRPLQSALFVLGVALGVAMVIAIDVANSSASRAFDLSTESVTGKATHQIVGGAGGLPTDLYRQVRLDLRLRQSAPIISEYVRAVELARPVRVLGVDPFAEPPFRSYLNNIDIEGDSSGAFDALNTFITQPNSILISQPLATRYGLAAGDTLTLRVGAQLKTATIVGILQPTDATSAEALDDLILCDISTAQELVGTTNRISRIDLILPAGYDTAQLTALLPDGARLVGVQDGNSTLRQMTAAFELNLQALSLLALVVGVFLIYNTVTFSVVQRRPILGVLRALGATRAQIFALVLGEALLLGVVGTALGMGMGVIFGRAAVGLVAQTISDLYFTVNVQNIAVPLWTLLKGAGVGVAASVLAALVPSFEATNTPPAGALRRSDTESRTLALIPQITAAGVALCAVGVALLQIPVSGWQSVWAVVVSFAALFCIVLGGALFTPLALLLLMRAATPLTERLFGVVGRMAPRAVSRSLSRTSVAVAALTIAVSVIVGVSVMVDSFRLSVADWLDSTLGADIYIAPALITASLSNADVDPAVRDQLAAVDGITRVASSRTVTVDAPAWPNLPPTNLVVVDEDISRRNTFAWLRVPEAAYRAVLAGGAVMVSEPFAFRRGITEATQSITLTTDRGPRDFPIIGVYYDYSTDQGAVFMYRTTYDQYWDDPYISAVAGFVAPDADLDAILTTLRRDTFAETDLLVQSNRQLRGGVFEVFDRAFSITIALRLLATLVAFIGILSALLALQLEHTRQYGVMRAVGMTPRGLWRFTLIQTGLMGGVAGVLALPLGLVLAWVLVYVINVRSFGWTMQLSPQGDAFAQAFGVAVVSALLAGIYPAWRLGQLVIARAVRGE
jgi:putative ABC transport system permease protein